MLGNTVRLLIITASLLCGFAQAIAAAIDLGHYRVQAFASDSGLGADSVAQIVRLADGQILTLGVRNEPVLFDGVHFGKPFYAPGQAFPKFSGAGSAVESSDGALWFAGSSVGLLRLHHGRLEQLNELAVCVESAVNGRDVLVGTRTELLRVSGDSPRQHAERLAQDLPYVITLLEQANGRIWIGTTNGLYRRDPGATKARLVNDALLAKAHIWDLHEDRNGRLLIATRGLGLAIAVPTDNFEAVEFVGSAQGLAHPVVRSIAEDQNSLWLATAGAGLVRLSEGKLESFDSALGLSSDSLTDVVVDQKGVLWVSTAGAGLNRLWPTPFNRMRDAGGRLGGFAYALHEDEQGAVWLGSNAGLAKINDGRIERISGMGGGQSGSVLSIVASPVNGELLLGTRRDALRFDTLSHARALIPGSDELGPSRWLAALKAPGDPRAYPALIKLDRILFYQDQSLRALLQMDKLSNGNRNEIQFALNHSGEQMLIASLGGSFIFDTQGLRRLSELPANALLQLEQNTFIAGHGLARWDGHQLSKISVVDPPSGLLDIRGMLDDGKNIWVTSAKGLFRWDRMIFARATNNIPLPSPDVYTVQDGLTSSEFESFPQSTMQSNGNIWLANTGGVNFVDPALAQVLPEKMQLTVRELEVEQTTLAASAGMSLAAGSKRVGINFGALPASHAQALKIQYRLLPIESAFRLDNGRRQALYAALSPGTYRFELRAKANSISVAPLAFEFSIAPKPIERTSVRIALVLVLILLMASVPLFHIYGLRRQRLRLIAEVSRQTQELEHLARTDGLSGLGNRRHFDEIAEGSLRDGKLEALLLLDVDHFKRFNDFYGHQGGDRCLRALGAVLLGVANDYHCQAFRIGGEEFALLLTHNEPVADIHTRTPASVVAQITCERVRALAIAHSSSDKGTVSVSIGVATLAPHENIDQLMQRADAALYQAKAHGRDRWQLASPLSS